MNKLTSEEIEEQIYGEYGLYRRVVNKIIDITPQEAAKLTNKTTQNVYNFIRLIDKDIAKPKLGTIVEISKALGVE